MRIRLIDLFKKYSEILDLLDEDLSMISKNISTIRNYYTHYSDDRRKELENTFSDYHEYYSIYDGVLYNLLLTVIYAEIGIPNNVIKESLPDLVTRFGIFPEDILEGPK